jgi:hypothetical protein
MAKITSKGNAGMIGGVRSPMATPSHGIVAKSPKMNPAGIHNATKRKTFDTGTAIRSPYEKKNIV